jgi:hypothetical protein
MGVPNHNAISSFAELLPQARWKALCVDGARANDKGRALPPGPKVPALLGARQPRWLTNLACM